MWADFLNVAFNMTIALVIIRMIQMGFSGTELDKALAYIFH